MAVVDGDEVADAQAAVEQDDEAAHVVARDLLQAEAQAHAERAAEDRERGDVDAHQRQRDQDRDEERERRAPASRRTTRVDISMRSVASTRPSVTRAIHMAMASVTASGDDGLDHEQQRDALLARR